MLSQVLDLLAMLAPAAVPLCLIAIVDDWVLRPKRRLAALPEAAVDTTVMKLIYALVPLSIVCVVVRLMRSETLDFALVLVEVVAGSALVWAVDRWLLAPRRAQAAEQRGQQAAAVELPTTVDYARSFLPVAIIVLLIRSFIFEPFRIPSDSMMPTLLDGDFIAVNKFAYGLRLPVLNLKLVETGQPQRGDVIVFRYPPNPRINYIKRLVGLPGDTVEVHSDQLIVNGQPVPQEARGTYDDGCYHNLRLLSEQLGTHRHDVMVCHSPVSLQPAEPGPRCTRQPQHNYVCIEPAGQTAAMNDLNDYSGVVPPGHYLMIGDNRDNSLDGRAWGFVPEANLAGRATRVLFNWDLGRSGGPKWRRIGQRIE